MNSIRKTICTFIAIILLLSLPAVTGIAGAESGNKNEIHWQDYNGKRLGILIGPLMEDTASKYFPDSEVFIFSSYPDCASALLAGKIDAYLIDEPGIKMLHYEQPEIDYIHESITENKLKTDGIY